MAILSVKIEKGPLGPKNPAQGYFPSVLPIGGSPGVAIDTTVGYPTQDKTVAEIRKKLTVSFQEGDTIRFDGHEHATVDDAIKAITAAAPNWK